MSDLPAPSPTLFENLVRVVNDYPISTILIGFCIFAFFFSLTLWVWFAKNNRTEDKRWARNASAASFVVAVLAILLMFFLVEPPQVFARGQLKEWQKLNTGLFQDLETARLSIAPTPEADSYYYRSKENVQEPTQYRWLLLYSGKIECPQARFVIRPTSPADAADDPSREINIVLNLDDPALKSVRGHTLIQLKYQPGAAKGRCVVILPNRRLSEAESARACRYEFGKEVADFPVCERATASRWSLISSAYAKPLETREINERLKSRDPEIRMRTRRDVARSGDDAMSWIEETLVRGNDAALKIEALRILVQMDTAKIIADLLDEANGPLRGAAVAYTTLLMSKNFLYRSQEPLAWVQKLFDEAADADRKSQLAVTLMELHYYLGVQAYLKFEHEPGDDGYKKSVAGFQKSLSFAAAAKPAARYKFALAHWGLAITYHQQYWRLPSNHAARADVEAKLKHELGEVAAVAGTDYKYPFHIAAAKKCLQSDLARDCIPRS